MTFAELATQLGVAVDASKKQLEVAATLEKKAVEAAEKATAAQEAYRTSLAAVKEVKAQFDASLADHLKG